MTAASMRARLRSVIAGAVAAAFVLSACGSGTETSTGDASESAEAAETDGQAASGPTALATVSGGQIDINDLEGRDTILWFWAPW